MPGEKENGRKTCILNRRKRLLYNMEALLARRGFLLYELLSPQEITARQFAACNRLMPEAPIVALPDVRFALAVRQEER